MSLINDALKKAKQAQDNAPVRETAPQLRSPDTDHRRYPGASLLWPGVIIVALLLGVGLVWFGLGARQAEPQHKIAASMARPSAPAPEPAPPVTAPTPLAAQTQQPTVAETVVSSAPMPMPVPVAAERPAPHFAPPPALPTAAPPKLNGIFYNPARPTAVVNNKLVRAGSRVGEFTVLAITQNSVTLAGGGQTNVLSLSE